jgi:hypothetical protein
MSANDSRVNPVFGMELELPVIQALSQQRKIVCGYPCGYRNID